MEVNGAREESEGAGARDSISKARTTSVLTAPVETVRTASSSKLSWPDGGFVKANMASRRNGCEGIVVDDER